MYIHCYLISLLKYSADTSIIYIAGKGKDTGKGDRTMRICGLNKTTLLDYPGHVAAAVFLEAVISDVPSAKMGIWC